MKVQATARTVTTVLGEIAHHELVEMIRATGLHVPPTAQVRVWVSGRAEFGDLEVDHEEPLRFSVVYQGEAITTPPALASGGTQT